MKPVNLGVRLTKDLFPYDFPLDTVSQEDREIIKITFRAPMYLRKQVKTIVKKNRVFRTENEFFLTSVWSYLMGLDLTQEVSLRIQRVLPDIFMKTMEEFQKETKNLVETQKNLLFELDSRVKPLLEGEKQIREGIVEEIREKREDLKLYLLYLIAQLQPIHYDVLKDHVLNEKRVTPWLIEDALAVLLKEQFIREEEPNTYVLLPFGLRKTNDNFK